jgi:hypothetical protein
MAKAKMNPKIKKLQALFNKPTTGSQFIKFLNNRGACLEAVKYVGKFKTPKEAWNKCDRFDWMDWLLRELNIGTSGEYAQFILEEFFEAYPEYLEWNTESYDWIDNLGTSTDVKITLKQMSKELRLFVPWSDVDKLVKIYI